MRPPRELLHLVLQPMSAAFQVHVLGVGVVEAALAQFAVEADHLPVVVADLRAQDTRAPGVEL